MKFSKQPPSRGFTLIEVMIVVVIVAILASVAYPSYRDSVYKSRRADAKAALLESAQLLERCYTQFNSYAAVGCNLSFPRASPEGHYQITAPTRTATTFSLQAAPLGAQAGDSKCANLTLTHTAARGASGTQPATECW